MYSIRTLLHHFWLHQKFHLFGIIFSLKCLGFFSHLFNIYLFFKEVSHQVEFPLMFLRVQITQFCTKKGRSSNGHALRPAYSSLSVCTQKNPTRHKWTQDQQFLHFIGLQSPLHILNFAVIQARGAF